MQDYLSKLNKEQYEAATCVDGALLILAGAGSGKTNTMTHRIAYMIKELGVSPYSVLALTFTNKAAGEMRERVEALIGRTPGMWIQTFHSACLRILRAHAERLGYGRSFVVYDPADQKSVIRSISKALDIDDKAFNAASLLGFISARKNSGVSAAEFEKSSFSRPDGKLLAAVYSAYEARLLKNNAMDFDDLLINALKLFERHPDILADYQKRFRYIMVDEYQDTNMIQYRLMQLLARAHGNICVVGDDDQCIYQWRGADIRNILEFEKDFPGARVIRLERNYRSSANIINAAHSIIVRNESRKSKRMRTDAADGEKIEYYRANDDKEEARWISEKIRAVMRKRPELGYSDFAVLYRNNAQSRRFEESLISKGLPYRVLSGMRYYDRAEVKDMIAYMRLVINPDDDVSLLRIINTPRRGIGKAKIDAVNALAGTKDISALEAMRELGIGEALSNLYSSLELEKDSLSVSEIYDILLDKSGYIDALRAQESPEADSRIENILEFRSEIIEKQQEAADNEEEFGIEKFMEDLALASDIDNHDPNEDAVVLMTLHSAKGLEFPVVFMPGMETGLFPSYRSFDKPGGVEEERRLCYVGMTRAKERLFMSSAEWRTMYGRRDVTGESQFLKEIDPKYLEGHALYERKLREAERYSSSAAVGERSYVSPIAIIKQMKEKPKRQTLAGVELNTGDKVEHTKFGTGSVVGIDGNIISVRFEEGIKKLAKDMAPLIKLE